jgi:uncharacterized protein (TIGR02284 family)
MKAVDRDVHVLQGVARLLSNQVSLYAQAARIADDAGLRAGLGKAQGERALLLTEVNAKITSSGAELPDDGAAAGAGQRALLNRGTYLVDDNRAALGEVERGEDLLHDRIAKRLDHDDLTPHTHNFLRTVLTRITPLRDEVADLKHARG